jgi:2-octaprenylphenol hydroxylase
MHIDSTQQTVVIGGGIIGLTSALAMQQAGHVVCVIDAHHESAQASQRVYAINHQSIALLTALGVWPKLHASGYTPFRQMRVSDASHGAVLELQAQSVAKAELGFIVTHDALKDVLLEQCIRAGIRVQTNTVVTRVEPHAQHVDIYSAQDHWHADLLMIAEGASSFTREQLGVQLTTWPYHHHAIVCTVTTEKPHHHTAYQCFYPQGPLAFLPLSDPHQCAIVWSLPPTHAEQYIQAPESTFNAELTARFGHQLGHITATTPRLQFPLHMRQAQQYVGNNWLLLGDAAHTVHPLAGLGLNLGLADLACWMKLMSCPSGLMRYQRERRYASWKLIGALEVVKQIFASTNPSVTMLRALGLSALNQTAFLKRALIDCAESI